MKKKIFITFLSVVMAITFMPLSVFAGTYTQSQETNRTNKEIAIEEFEVPEANVVDSAATTVRELDSDMKKASEKAISSSKWAMVYATKNITVERRTSIPENVVLCAADATTFTFTNDNRISLLGAVFGGTFEGDNKCAMGMVLTQDYSGKNGTVKYCTFQNFKTNGVWISSGRAGKIISNKINNNGINGIRIQPGNHIERIEGNVISNSKEQSGIDIDAEQVDQVTKVDYILNNTIYGNNGHGISTNTQDAQKRTVPGASCQMIQVDNNKIYNNGHEAGNQGLWMEDNCKITKSLNNNDIYNNAWNGLALDSGAEVNGVANNDIYGNGSSNISLLSETSQVTKLNMTMGNQVHASKKGPEIATEGSVAIHITGKNNQFFDAPLVSNEIYLGSASSLVVTGGMTITPKYNEHPSISFNKISTVELHNVTINAKSADWISVYYDKTCNFYRENCKIYGRTYIKQDVDPLPTVSSFSSKALNSKSCYLSWNKASNKTATASKYLVYRGTSPSGSWPCIGTTNETNYTDNNVKAGNKYYYMVKPAFSSGDDFVYGSYSPKDYAYPRINALTGFSAKAISIKTAQLSWNKCLDQDAEFWIYRGTKPTGDWGPVYAKVTDIGATSWTEDVTPGTKYYYMVREAVKGNDGKYYFGPYTKVDYAYPRPPVPKNFKAWAVDKSTCKCSWSEVSTAGIDKLQYFVYRGTAPTGKWDTVGILSDSQTSFTDKELKSGRKYYYMVRVKAWVDGKVYFSDYSTKDYGYPR